MNNWLKKVGMPYYYPHKFRHGHAVYALSMAKDVAALKAVSQNLMHENLTVTDGVYGVLSDRDVRKQIANLGEMVPSQSMGDTSTVIMAVEKLLIELKKSNVGEPS